MDDHGASDRYLVRSTDGEVVGPVSGDQLRRGVAAGRVPRDAHIQLEGTSEWQTVSKLLREAEALEPKANAAATSAPIRPTTPSKRYANLLKVSASLEAYGSLLRLLAWVLGVVAAVGGALLFDRLGAGGISVIVVGIGGGFALHATGTVIAAMGESLLALADIATNTGRMVDGPDR